MFVDTVLIKVASRCNLDCSYCYVYHMGDEAWRALPKRLSPTLSDQIVTELADLRQTQGRPFSVVLHGGEPLLIGARGLDELLRKLRRSLGGDCGISIQTNGVLLSAPTIDVCAQHRTTICVSLDGPPEIHDAFRVDRRRLPTHSAVMKGLQALKAHPGGEYLFSGVLAVVDPATSAESVYDYFKELGVPSVDFLYRDGNHSKLPFGKAS